MFRASQIMNKMTKFPQVWQTIKYESDFMGKKYSEKVDYFYNTTINSSNELTDFFEGSSHESCFNVEQVS